MKKMFLAVALFVCCSNAFGVEKDKVGAEPMRPDTLSLDEIVVTGSRVAAKRGNVAQRIELVSADKIEIAPSTELVNVLKNVTGVNIVDYGGMLSGISIRGFKPEFDNLGGKNSILIDGRPAASSNLSVLDVSNAERIEVLRGPASSVYGPTAMGGVVNIITKKSTSGFGGRFSLGAGSFGSNLLEGTIGGAVPNSKLNFDIAASRIERGNYTTGNGGIFRKWLGGEKALFSTEKVTPENGFTTEKVKNDDARGDGAKIDYSNFVKSTYSTRLGYNFTPNWSVNLFYDNSTANDVGSPADIMKAYYPSKKDVSRESADLSVNGTAGKFQIFARGYYGQQQSDAIDVYNWDGSKLDQEFMSFRSKFDWKGAQLNATTSLGIAQITVGTDYSIAESYSHRFDNLGVELAPYSLNYSLGTFGVYQQTKLNFLDERLIATIGLRYDLNEYKTKTSDFNPDQQGTSKDNHFFTPSVGLKYKLTSDLHVNATYGKGYSYANPFHLTGYWANISTQEPGGVALEVGNPKLKNQESDTYDFGFNYSNPSNGITFEATYFDTKQKNSSVAKFYTQGEISADLLSSHDVSFSESDGKFYTTEGKQIVSFSSYENAFKSKLRGIELSASYNFGALAANRYSLLVFANCVAMLTMEEDYTNALGETATRDIFNVAKNSVNFGVDYSDNKVFSAGISGRYVGYRYDYDWTDWQNPATVRYPRMMTVDFYTKANVTHALSCIFSVNNVTDENYYEKRDYNLLGRNFNFKIVYCF